MINPIVKTIELPDGRTITLETGKLAKQADGSVMLRMGLLRRLTVESKGSHTEALYVLYAIFVRCLLPALDNQLF